MTTLMMDFTIIMMGTTIIIMAHIMNMIFKNIGNDNLSPINESKSESISPAGLPYGARFFSFVLLLFAGIFLAPQWLSSPAEPASGTPAPDQTSNSKLQTSNPAAPATGAPALDSARYYLKIGQELFPANPRRAIGYLEKVIDFTGRPPIPGSDTILLEALQTLGRCYGKVQEYLPAYDSCEHFHRLALEHAVRTSGENSLMAARCMNNLGGVYAGKGCAMQSLEIRLRGLRIAESLPNTPKTQDYRVRVCTNIGLLYDGIGDKTLAGRYLAQAVQWLPGSGSGAYVCINVHGNYAQFLADEGRMDEAMANMDAARAYLNERDTLHLISHWETLGSIYRAVGAPDSALLYDGMVLRAVEHKILGRTDIAHAHYKMALNYFNKNQWDNSIGHLNQSITIEQEVFGDKFPFLAVAYHLKGQCFMKKGDPVQAELFFEKSLSANNYDKCEVECLDNPATGMLAFQDLADLRITNGRLTDALEYLKLAERAMALQGRRYNATASKEKMSETAHSLFETGVQLACRLWKQTGDPKYREDAFYFAEQSKAQVLREAVRASSAARFAGVPKEVLKRQRALRVEMEEHEKSMQGIFSDSIYRTLQAHRFELQRKEAAFQAELRVEYPKLFEAQYGRPPVHSGVLRDTLLRPDQELVEYFIGDSSITAFVLGPGRFDIIPIPLDFPLEEWVQKFVRGIIGNDDTKIPNPGARLDDYLKYGHLLYQKLVAPLALCAPSVLIVPDGVLGALPFEALLTDTPRDRGVFGKYPYLLRRHSIGYCPSATLLLEMTQKQHITPPAEPFLAFAPFTQNGTGDLSGIFPDRNALRSGLGPLPFSLDEAMAGQRLFNGGKGSVFSGKKATKATFIEQASRARILLLSLHGFAETKAGDFAFLAFSPAPGSPLEAFLFLSEIYALELNADLVLLSACETGIGRLARGEGIISLARAFAFAGAKSVAATFWTIETEPTAKIMKQFYSQLAAQKTKDVALHLAKTTYLDDESMTNALHHPYYWAGIVAIGDMGALR
jgi:CHAT domain-containing protein/Tfp pilus assembly protein PilF